MAPLFSPCMDHSVCSYLVPMVHIRSLYFISRAVFKTCCHSLVFSGTFEVTTNLMYQLCFCYWVQKPTVADVGHSNIKALKKNGKMSKGFDKG